MSRARDLANLGNQAESGLDASDITTGTFSTSVIPDLAGDKITSGTLSNTVQDNITRLGTVASGTFNGTIGNSATFPNGNVLQVVSTLGDQQAGSGGIVLKYMEVSLTTKSANSDFLVMCNVNWGSLGTSSNMDTYDIAFAMAYKLASAADSAYVGISSNRSAYDRRGFSGTNIGSQAWYCTDVPWSPNRSDQFSGGYDTFNQSFSGLDQSHSLSSGTAIKYACYVDAYDTYYISRSRTTTGSGGMSSLTVMEIKNV